MGQPFALGIFFIRPAQQHAVKEEEAICPRTCKGVIVKRGSLLMNAFCVRLHTCIMKMVILKKLSQKWSFVPDKPSAKLCNKQKTGALSVSQLFLIYVLDISAISPEKC